MDTLRLLAVASVVAGAAALQQQAHLLGGDPVGEALPGGPSPFDEMSAKMGVLQAGMEKAKEQRRDIMKKQKTIYETGLQQQQERNRNVEASNEGLARDIATLRTSNAELREKCTAITHNSEDVTADLRKLQTNISFAQEFGRRALNASDLALHASSELKVLNVLEEQSKKHEEEQEKKKRLQEFEATDSSMAMLQLQVHQRQPGTDELMKELLSSFDAVTDEQNATMSSLKVAFEKELETGNQRYETLLKEQTELTATKALEERLSSDLAAAQKHLQATYEHVLQQRDSVKEFAVKLSTRPIPEQEAESIKSQTLPSHEEEVAEKPVSKLLNWLKR